MHLKSCCALLLLALAACQAAPSPSKFIEKRSITEETSKIETTDLGLENPGAEKERTKKSTTFCVEVHAGTKQQVPCPDQHTEHIQLVESPKPVQLVQTHVAPAAQTVQLIQTPSQPVPVKFEAVPSPPPQPIHTIHVQPAPQPVHTVHVQSVPQQIQALQVQSQPASQPVQLVVPQQQPQSQPNIVLPPPPAPAPQQPPIVNILTPPAAPCNVMPASTVIHESKPEPSKLEKIEDPKPPMPKLQPTEYDFVSVETEPACDDVYVVPAKPAVMIPERITLQKAQVGYYRPQMAMLDTTSCVCGHKKSSPLTWARTHHPKIHEHHVMVHPSGPAPMMIQPSYPASYMPQNPTPVAFTSSSPQKNGDTIVSVYQNSGRSYYDNEYPSRVVASPTYVSYPTETYSYGPEVPAVTGNSYPKVYYRDAQSTPTSNKMLQQAQQHQPTISKVLDLSKGTMKTTGSQKREAETNHLDTGVQNLTQEQLTGLNMIVQGATSQAIEATSTK